MPDQRRAILKASALGIIVYAIVVLVYANLTPYIGIRFFVDHVQKIEVSPVDFATDGVALPFPNPGDRVIEIAGDNVRVDVVKEGGKLVERERSPLGSIVSTTANLRNDEMYPSTEVKSLADLHGLSAGVANIGPTRFVRIRFEAPADDPEHRGTFSRWFLVGDAPLSQSRYSIAWFAIESVVFWLGWLVFRRRPEDESAALFFLMCIVTVGAYMGWYHWQEIASNPALVFVFAACAMAVPQISLHFHLVTLSPRRLVQRYPRLTWTFLYGIPCLLQCGILWSISRMFYTFRHGIPVAGAYWEGVLQALLWIYITIGGLMFVGCLASLWHTYAFPRQPSQRDQVRWMLAGSLVAGVFIGYSFWVAFTDLPYFLVGGATWAMFLASLSFAASHAVSILRYRLFRIEEIVEQRGWKYLILRFLGTIGFYGLVLVVIGLTPRLFAGVPQPTGLLITSFVCLVLYILTTIRSWTWAIIDRRFYRERSQLDWAMRRMNEAVGNLVDPSVVHQHVLVIAAGCAGAKRGGLYLKSPRNSFALADSIGSPPFPDRIDSNHALIERMKEGDLLQKAPRALIREDVVSQFLRSAGAELAQPLVHDGKLIGFLLLGAKQEGMYNSAEMSFLAGIADLATIALHGAQSQQTLDKLNRDLRHRVERVSTSLALADRTPAPAPLAPPIIDRPPLAHVESLRGSGTAIGSILQTVRKVATSTATVLVRGESGTGKSMLAEVIHRNSLRAEGPFVKVHCAALSSSLLESELFGHVKGAYTGAHRDKVGRFQLADGGTLFLDEIGDISLDTQTKLLRVLQEMTFEPVGSSDSIHVDVRIIAATHQPLEELIRKGRLREDLYYRLNVISIRMPSLRERREDIPELAQHFLANYARQTGKAVDQIDDEAMELLVSHEWTGNIRELQNVIEHAVVMASGSAITRADLPGDLHTSGSWRDESIEVEPVASRTRFAAEPARSTSLVVELDDIERQRLIDTLETVAGNKSKAARILGMPRSTLCSKLKKYGID